MFGIGMPEMLLILAVALIVFGPKRLPELAKSLGRALGEFKRATTDIKQSIETETGLNEVRDSIQGVKEDIKSQVDVSGSPGPAPASAPDGTPYGKTDGKANDAEPLSRVKKAFDQMNTDSGRPPADDAQTGTESPDSDRKTPAGKAPSNE